MTLWPTTESRILSFTRFFCSFGKDGKERKKFFTQRSIGTPQNSLICQLRSNVLRNIWKHDQRLIDILRSTTPSINDMLFLKKFDWDKYTSQCLILKHLICQSCLSRLRLFTAHKKSSTDIVTESYYKVKTSMKHSQTRMAPIGTTTPRKIHGGMAFDVFCSQYT